MGSKVKNVLKLPICFFSLLKWERFLLQLTVLKREIKARDAKKKAEEEAKAKGQATFEAGIEVVEGILKHFEKGEKVVTEPVNTVAFEDIDFDLFD